MIWQYFTEFNMLSIAGLHDISVRMLLEFNIQIGNRAPGLDPTQILFPNQFVIMSNLEPS